MWKISYPTYHARHNGILYMFHVMVPHQVHHCKLLQLCYVLCQPSLYNNTLLFIKSSRLLASCFPQFLYPSQVFDVAFDTRNGRTYLCMQNSIGSQVVRITLRYVRMLRGCGGVPEDVVSRYCQVQLSTSQAYVCIRQEILFCIATYTRCIR